MLYIDISSLMETEYSANLLCILFMEHDQLIVPLVRRLVVSKKLSFSLLMQFWLSLRFTELPKRNIRVLGLAKLEKF